MMTVKVPPRLGGAPAEVGAGGGAAPAGAARGPGGSGGWCAGLGAGRRAGGSGGGGGGAGGQGHARAPDGEAAKCLATRQSPASGLRKSMLIHVQALPMVRFWRFCRVQRL